MREDTRERLITAVIRPLAYSCALSRLRDLQESQDEFRDWNWPALGQPNLIDAGTRAGLTVGECCGVMDGWDGAEEHIREIFSDLRCFYRGEAVIFAQEEYDRGRELGRELRVLAG